MRWRAEDLNTFSRTLLERLGVSPADAGVVVDVVVEAELRGIESHGMAQLPFHVQKVIRGEANPNPRICSTQVAPALVALAADGALGPVAATRAAEVLAQLTTENGVAAVVVHHAHAFGPAGHYVRTLAEQGLVALLFSNTLPLMAPWGAYGRLLGTNPVGVGIPAGRHPVVVDLALSETAWGNIVLAQQDGRPLNAAVALDSRGLPTDDPTAALAGSLLPMAGAKGSALALAVELLTGLLSPAELDEPVSGVPGGVRPRLRSFLFLGIDPNRLHSPGRFAERVERWLGQLASLPVRPDMGPARVPGERGERLRAQRLAAGLALTEPTRVALAALGKQYGIPWPAPVAG